MLMLRPLARYADFQGRSHRGEYVQFLAGQALLFGTLSVLLFKALSSDGLSLSGAAPILLGGVFLAWAALLVPNMALKARRLHDTDRSARWMGLMLPGILAPVIMIGSALKLVHQVTDGGATEEVVLAQMGSASFASLLWVLGMIGNVVLFGMLLMPGTSGTNRFGADPKDGAAWGTETSNVFDDARLELLFAEARRNPETPDVTPGPVARLQGQASPRPDWSAKAQVYGAAPAGGFGRRGG